MTIGKQFRSVERRFVVTIVTLTTFSILALGLVLYEATTLRFSNQVSSDELTSMVANDPAVSEYLEQEKDFQPHFITIANMVKQEQQSSLTQALILITIPVLIVSGSIGYLVAKHLLKPVKESYESQERFMQDAAHELRNPLAAISIALQNGGAGENTKLITTLRRQTNRLVGIVEDMLFLERRKSGDKVADTDISVLLRDVLEDLQPAISSRALKLKTQIEDEIIIRIDPQDFIKLTRNLLENAIKYSGDGKNIAVIMKKTGRVNLQIIDQGIGIPESEIQSIGERFYRAKNVGKVSGTGLGIAIVKKVLNAYGGKMTISSTLGKGTTVNITL
jgi:signal transduction histidine kinase